MIRISSDLFSFLNKRQKMGLGSFKSKDDTQGIRVCIDETDGVFLFVRRVSNSDYQTGVQRLIKKGRKPGRADPKKFANRNGGEGNDKAEAIALVLSAVDKEDRKILAAKHLLVGWENLVDDNNDFPEWHEEGSQRIRYCPESCHALLTHERYEDFYDLVVEIASERAIFQEAQQKEDTENLSDASGGTSKTKNQPETEQTWPHTGEPQHAVE